MSKINFYTLGVYGLSDKEFFKIITDNNIDTFCDIRRRRAVRGSLYSFANSSRLQKKLEELNINYLHILDLSPSDELRGMQMKEDKKNNVSISKRQLLSPTFISEYKKQIIGKFDFDAFIKELIKIKAKHVLLFCVERNADACHRSLLTNHLSEKYSAKIKHL